MLLPRSGTDIPRRCRVRPRGGFSLDSYEPDLREAISAYEQALGLIPEEEVQTRAYVLDRLAQGYFELGFAYLSTDRNAQEEAFRKGRTTHWRASGSIRSS